MTNVPDENRELWTDLYKFYDIHYLMGNTAEDWSTFWDDAEQIYKRHDGKPLLIKFITAIAEDFESRLKKG